MKTTSLETLLGKHMTQPSRSRAKQRASEILEQMELAEIRKALKFTHRGLARTMKIAQPTLAKIEKNPDMRIATLRKVVRALGGEIDIIARFPEASVRIRLAE